MRKAISTAYINVRNASALAAGSSTVYVPDYRLGETVLCDSGLYIYMQANGAVAEGYLCKFVEGTWDADTVTHTEGDTTNLALAICVTDGGLADNQYGWFWRGMGTEYAYVDSTVAAADTQLKLCTTAGRVDDSTDGTDIIHDLFNVAVVSAAGLNLVRSTVLLSVNASITN